ncbi:MAG: hypothetical protein AB8H47_17990 [Bacteroidia bacterium]
MLPFPMDQGKCPIYDIRFDLPSLMHFSASQNARTQTSIELADQFGLFVDRSIWANSL